MVDITIFEVHLGDIDVPAPFEATGGASAGSREGDGGEETEIAIEESGSGEGGGLVGLLVTIGTVIAVAAVARRLRNRQRTREREAAETSQTTLSSE